MKEIRTSLYLLSDRCGYPDMQSNTGLHFNNLEQKFSYKEGLQPSRRPSKYWKTLGLSKSKTNIQEQEARAVIQTHIEVTCPATGIVFTDGSCWGNHGPCVAGACLYLPRQDKLNEPVAKIASILREELIAINIALKFCLKEVDRSQVEHIRIFFYVLLDFCNLVGIPITTKLQ